MSLTANELLAVAAGLFGIAFVCCLVLVMGSRTRRQQDAPPPINNRPAYAEPPTYDAKAALQRRMERGEAGLCPITGEPGITSSQRKIPQHLEAAYQEWRDAEIDKRLVVLKTRDVAWWRAPAPKETEIGIPVEGTIFERIKRGKE